MGKEKDMWEDITNSTKFLSVLNEYAADLIKNNGVAAKEMFPHIIFSHGFQTWYRLPTTQFPAFGWWGKEELEDGVNPEDAERAFTRFLFDRFFTHLTSMSTFHWLGKGEKKELREKGWLGYLED